MSPIWNSWRRNRSNTDDEDVGQHDSTFEWRYEPAYEATDADSLFELSPMPSRDRRFGVERQSPVPVHHSGNETSQQPVRESSDNAPERDVPDGAAHDRGEVSATIVDADSLGDGAAQLRQQLNDDLDRWWRHGAVPSRVVLRNGLQAMEAGYPLDESQRTLLLRAALRYGRGLVTATRHHDNLSLSAILIAESIVDPNHPLQLDNLDSLLQDSQIGADLRVHVAEELYLQGTMESSERRLLASAGLEHCGYGFAHVEQVELDLAVERGRWRGPTISHWSRQRILILVAAIAVIAVTALWTMRANTGAGSVQVPEGRYQVGGVSEDRDGAGSGIAEDARTVSLPKYSIDKMEVTNAQYRRCYQRGACGRPADSLEDIQQTGFLDPAFNDHPVTYVTLDDVNAYCAWMGQQLPTADEWEVAASAAIASGKRYRYPWGDYFDVRLANGADARVGHTQRVGSYRSAGDSPTGASDMAGNVAEWTSTPVGDGKTGNVVKGGSFQDSAPNLRATAVTSATDDTRADWLGFRCMQPSTISSLTIAYSSRIRDFGAHSVALIEVRTSPYVDGDDGYAGHLMCSCRQLDLPRT